MGRACSQMGEGMRSFKILTGKRPLQSPRRRCEDNIRMYLKENIYQYEKLD